MKFFFYSLFLISVLLLNWGTAILHRGVFPRPTPVSEDQIQKNLSSEMKWIPRTATHPLNHLVLVGPPIERGYFAGKSTKDLLYLQEESLDSELTKHFPFLWMIRPFVITGLIRWFSGIERYFEKEFTDEMYGVSLSTSHKFDFYADRFTRQIAYHGLHEVGQIMVDQKLVGFGCTVLALPHQGRWLLGRNFDFEGGRIFDEEKIIKWVFPEQGYAFVSVTWAGMVGVVTGVNEHGLYISINAAGSSGYSRHGTPSTLVALKALQYANSAKEASEIIKNEKMLITEIFVLADKNGDLFRVEKSPKRFAFEKIEKASAIANHLKTPEFSQDSTNLWRKEQLTTVFRETRGQQLMNSLSSEVQAQKLNQDEIISRLLSSLRDKKNDAGTSLHLGNRRAIDGLISTHAVIYDSLSGVFYISTGPGLVGKFEGFDLQASFENKTPISVKTLPEDQALTPTDFWKIKNGIASLERNERLLLDGACEEVKENIYRFEQVHFTHYLLEKLKGDFASKCLGDPKLKKFYYQSSLALAPDYRKAHIEIEKGAQ